MWAIGIHANGLVIGKRTAEPALNDQTLVARQVGCFMNGVVRHRGRSLPQDIEIPLEALPRRAENASQSRKGLAQPVSYSGASPSLFDRHTRWWMRSGMLSCVLTHACEQGAHRILRT